MADADNPVLSFLRAHQDAMVEDLRQFVEQETPSRDASALEHFASSFLECLSTVPGVEATVIEGTPGSTHVRAELGVIGDRAPILLLGHFDTVWPLGTLARMPFRVEGDRAHGPGTFDMKGGLVQGMWALRALAEYGSALPPIVFLANSDEEIGSPGSREMIEDEARRATAVLVLEPSLDGCLKSARNGVGRFRIDVTGRAAHAGLDPKAGVSAIDELSKLVLDLQAVAEGVAPAGSVNVGVFGGGERFNCVAATAWAELAYRAPTHGELARIAEAITRLRPRHPEADIKVSGGLIWPPMERTQTTDVLVRHARDRALELGFCVLDVAAGGAGDANLCSAVGAAVLDGLGPVGGGAHAADEHIVLSEMPRRAALVAEMVRTFEPGVAADLDALAQLDSVAT
jgi:glutamate carboxypeptidase